ncbi:response regulator transcription factor [Noviherbaspirillum aerium]|uniref:response regulator transcription factor n=1 Tax=Noviherbaspirillum aerium TaxID=2588497 RepID=UPI00178C2A4B|nr:response regulator [Noviherbaspirillum aerium]
MATIGVIDDDAAIRYAMENLLEAAGYEPISFDSGEAFLAWPHLGRIDIVLSDVKLRGMSGFALLEQFVVRHPTVPLIFISGNNDLEMEQRALHAGALGVLSKPVNPDILLGQIERALAVRRTCHG